jgi:BMFP domain-containing protein YqiC
MPDRPRIIDDLAGVAGGAFSALLGVREELEAMLRARVDETIRRLDLVRRDEFDAMAELARRAADARLAAEERLAAIEARLTALEDQPKP